MFTENEIRNMPAGPELDELIAFWVFREQKPAYTHKRHIDVRYHGKSWLCLPEYEKGDVCHWVPLGYSTTPSYAWYVINAMREIDFWWSASYKTAVFYDELNKPGYEVRFRCVRAGTRGDWFAAAKTLELAICRAALMAAEANEIAK